MATAGYSGTPLSRKLGLKPGSRLCLIDAPEGALALLAPLPQEVQTVAAVDADTDLIWLYARERARLQAHLSRLRQQIRADAMIWVSWPKKASKLPTDISEDTIREIALPLGLVDIKVCAVDAVWSGLKLVIRRELR